MVRGMEFRLVAKVELARMILYHPLNQTSSVWRHELAERAQVPMKKNVWFFAWRKRVAESGSVKGTLMWPSIWFSSFFMSQKDQTRTNWNTAKKFVQKLVSPGQGWFLNLFRSFHAKKEAMGSQLQFASNILRCQMLDCETNKTRSHTRGVDALLAHPSNLQDAVGRICPNHFCGVFPKHQRVRKRPNMPTSEALRQLHFLIKSRKHLTTKEPLPKDDALHKVLAIGLTCPPGTKGEIARASAASFGELCKTVNFSASVQYVHFQTRFNGMQIKPVTRNFQMTVYIIKMKFIFRIPTDVPWQPKDICFSKRKWRKFAQLSLISNWFVTCSWKAIDFSLIRTCLGCSLLSHRFWISDLSFLLIDGPVKLFSRGTIYFDTCEALR